ncbi:hypothetical protein PQY66_06235 [Luminiphilus sp.]|nr:hypothetical protein [Luminiphilus sp.]
MSIFTSAKAKLAAQKLAEEKLYELAAEEITANNIRPGLWAKAIAESDGDDAKAKARYIKLRVETMKAEADLQDYASANVEKERAEMEKREEERKREMEKREEERRREEARDAVNQPTGVPPNFTPVVVAFILLLLSLVFFA